MGPSVDANNLGKSVCYCTKWHQCCTHTVSEIPHITGRRIFVIQITTENAFDNFCRCFTAVLMQSERPRWRLK